MSAASRKFINFDSMNDQEKKRQLTKYKLFATGLFVLMAIIFVITTVMQKNNDAHWLGYVNAFSEAAMVGALADWFAVTALFHYPLGIKIPHTNLIQNKKDQIGDNLGNFVVDNFLAPENIRPYILKLKISRFVGDWLSKPNNQETLVKESSSILLSIISKLDDSAVTHFISVKVKEMADDIKINALAGNILEYLIDNQQHQRLITSLSSEIKKYVQNNQDMVRERVKKESFALIPKFVDDTIADKITKGLADYFNELEQDPHHPLRQEITYKILDFSEEIKTDEKWKHEFNNIKNSFLSEEQLKKFSTDVWDSIKKTLSDELSQEDSPLKKYILKNLNELSHNLKTDEALQHKIDGWIQVTAYKYILKNTHQFGNLISSTVGNWEGKELSNKLELEVGKDLQFIRVNGTLVGGLVGLVIYTIAQFFI